MGQGCDNDGRIIRPGARHQITKMVGNDKGQLAMRQHGRLWLAGRAGGKEEPRGIVTIHFSYGNRHVRELCHERVVIILSGPADRDGEGNILASCNMGVELSPCQQPFGPRRHGKPCDLLRRLAEIGGHPNAAELPASKSGLEHLVAVRRLHQQTVTLAHVIAVAQGGGEGGGTGFQRGPGPSFFAPDQTDFLRLASRRVCQKLREVHDAGRDRLHHATRSRIEA